MTISLGEFEPRFWSHHADAAELRAAWNAGATGDTFTASDRLQRAFLALLRREDAAARGVALEFFDRARALSRFGTASPLEPHRAEALAVARRMLQRPPRPGDAVAFEGADHASALLALKNDAGPEDAEAVTAVLRRRPHGELLSGALGVAGTVLGRSEAPDARLVALAGELALDRALDRDERLTALGTLSRASSDAATALLVRATDEDDPRLQQEAAWRLSIGERFYAHRSLLESLDASWPDEERGFAADEVREALDPGPHSTYWRGAHLGPGMRAAHGEMRAPTSARAHRRAFRTMLYSGLVPAVGIALDHFCAADGLARFDLSTEAQRPAVRSLARHLLALAPSAAKASPETGAGASHASALDVLALLAEPVDAPRLAAALRRRAAPPLVRERAVQAARACLERWDEPDERVIAALEALILDPSAATDDRTLAVVALFDVPGPRATAVLRRAACSSVLPVQVEAALGLTWDHRLDHHRDLVRDLLVSWPEAGRTDRARLVRDALRE